MTPFWALVIGLGVAWFILSGRALSLYEAVVGSTIRDPYTDSRPPGGPV